MDLIVQGMYQRKIVSVKTSQDLLTLLCCDVYNENCLHRTCSACKNKVVRNSMILFKLRTGSGKPNRTCLKE